MSHLPKSLLLCLLLLASLPVFAWPTFKHAPGLEIEWATEKMIYNGLPMKVENFKCDCSMEDVLEYYRRYWGRKKQGYVENDLGDYQQLVRGEKKYLYTVMVKAAPDNFDHSVGRLVISPIPDEEQERYVMGEGVPAKGDPTVVSDVYDAVPGKRSRTVLMMSNLSVEENAKYYHNYYTTRGWKPYLRPMADDMGVQALSFSHKKKDTNIVITDVGFQTSVLYNEVTDSF